MRFLNFSPKVSADMRTIDLSVYLVLDPDLCHGAQGMIDTALAAAQNGATAVQLRAPSWKKRALYECAVALKQKLSPLHVPLIINDHADVCVASNADGLHVGQQDLPVEAARHIIGPDRALGLSVSFPDELDLVDPTLVDHLGVGPIFATTTKPDASRPMGLDGFTEIATHKICPIVAIGSVNTSNAARLIAAGADGVAVVSAICGQNDPGYATRQLAEIVRLAQINVS